MNIFGSVFTNGAAIAPNLQLLFAGAAALTAMGIAAIILAFFVAAMQRGVRK